jgi:hypothetical protein
MTTSITVETHDWPVQVTFVEMDDIGHAVSNREEVVPPNTVRIIHIHSTMYVRVVELPKPETS